MSIIPWDSHGSIMSKRAILTGEIIRAIKCSTDLIAGYLENTDNISRKHGQHGHGQHAKSNPNCNPNPNPDYYFT